MMLAISANWLVGNVHVIVNIHRRELYGTFWRYPVMEAPSARRTLFDAATTSFSSVTSTRPDRIVGTVARPQHVILPPAEECCRPENDVSTSLDHLWPVSGSMGLQDRCELRCNGEGSMASAIDVAAHFDLFFDLLDDSCLPTIERWRSSGADYLT